jgi:fumarate hydratase subunit beta
MKAMQTPITVDKINCLKAGDEVLLNGAIYTARDQAHKRLNGLIKSNKKLPFDLKRRTIYYCGPTQTPKGKVIGSCGPTTSKRMDIFTPLLLKSGLKAMIGKGERSKEVINAIKKYKAVYLLAPAGCGALLSKFVVKKELVAFKDLGPEAIYRLEVKDFPVIVGIDAKGRSVFNNI